MRTSILIFLPSLLFFLSVWGDRLRVENFSSLLLEKENFSIQPLFSDSEIDSSVQVKNAVALPTESLIIKRDLPKQAISHHSFTKQEQLFFQSPRVRWESGIHQEAPLFLGLGSSLNLPGWSAYLREDRLSSFSVIFYFYPTSVRNREILLQSQERNFLGEDLAPIRFSFSIEDGKLVWQGINFFHFEDKTKRYFLASRKTLSVRLASTQSVRFNQWNKVALSYDRQSGLVALSLDDERVDSTYASEDGTPFSTLYYPGFLDSLHSTVLGYDFIGKIDEIGLYEGSFFDPDQMDSQLVAKFKSKVFQLKPFSWIDQVKLKGRNLDPDRLSVYLCSSLDYFREKENPLECPKIPWILDRETDQAEAIRSRKMMFQNRMVANFFQFFLVYRHPLEEKKSLIEDAQLNWLELDYTPNPRPLPPDNLSLELKPNGIFLTWNQSIAPQIAGFEIFYRRHTFSGDKKILFLTPQEVESFSGKQGYLIKGLAENHLYYFAVKKVALVSGQKQWSDFSEIKKILYSSQYF